MTWNCVCTERDEAHQEKKNKHVGKSQVNKVIIV